MAEINDLNVVDASNTARFPELMAASSVNNNLRALEGLLARAFVDTIDGIVVTGGSSTAYTATANRTIGAYYEGLTMCIQLHVACGANPTLNVDGVGPQDLKFPDGTQPAANDLPINAIMLVKYDLSATDWVILTQPSIATAASLGLVIGTDTQAWDAGLDNIAAITLNKGDLITTNGSTWSDLPIGGTNDHVLTVDSGEALGMKWAAIPPGLTVGTSQASTSGTAIDFTGLPSGINRIQVLLDQVSFSGSDHLLVQLGDATSFEATGYDSGSRVSGTLATSTAGFVVYIGSTSDDVSGVMTICRRDGTSWVASHSVDHNTHSGLFGGGDKTLTGTLTRLRVTRTGTDTFDAGNINIMYE